MPVPTRREFLKVAALAAAGVALHRCRAGQKRGVHDVAVLGAGMAGLASARDLVAAGLDVVVLEARDRAGGRVQTLHEPAPHGLEVGAQMIHGSRAPTWALVREFGLQTRPFRPWNTWRWRPGRGFSRPEEKIDEALRLRLVEAFHAYRGEDVSYQQFLDQAGFEVGEREALAWQALSWSAEPDEISLRAALEDGAAWDTFLDRNYQVVGGYDAIPRRLGEELGDRLRLSSPVGQVEWKPGEVRITIERDGRSDLLLARRAIVTLPIGVLQSGRPGFTPDLPVWKRRAVDSLRMGRIVVAHFLFDRPFWRERVPDFPGWSAKGGRVSFWDPHPPGAGAPVLLGWISGRAAQELSDLGQPEGLARALTWVEEALPRSGARQRVRWSSLRDWVRDPYTLGSYSFTRPGGQGQRDALATPLLDTLYFAGEATAPAPHYQTVHGAFASGRRAAREILASLGRDLVERDSLPGDLLAFAPRLGILRG